MLLAVLLTQPNQFVGLDTLASGLWELDPPPGASTTIRGYVSVLRRALASATDGGADIIGTSPGGYRVAVHPDELDVEDFEGLISQARERRAAGWPQEALRLLQEASELWRGDPLSDIDSPHLAHTWVPRLEAQHREAVSERIELSLQLGYHSEVLPELHELVAAHPLDEDLRGQLMRALALAGRQSEALAAYREARSELAEETGLSPGVALQDLQTALLRGEPADAGSQGASVGAHISPEPPSAPCELPPVVPDLVGRDELIAELERHWAEPVPGRAHGRLAVLWGPPGVGKTSVAVEAAHRLAQQFPDGQLWLELDGDDSEERVRAVLRRVLRTLGESPDDLPGELTALVSRYHRITSDRRLLVVVDGTRSDTAACPLVPTGPSCGAVVTSREPLPRLAGAWRRRVGGLSLDACHALLRAVNGEGWAEDDDAAVLACVEVCDGLPGAVRALAARLASRPEWGIARHAQRLTDPDRLLDELALGDPAVAEPVAQAVSECAPAERRLLWRLADVGSEPIAAEQAARIAGAEVAAAEEALGRLCDRGLLRPVGSDPPTYRLAHLAHAYAHRQLGVSPWSEAG